jgi:hypothetical protein
MERIQNRQTCLRLERCELMKTKSFDEIEREVREFQLELGEHDWYDLWHLHLDFDGNGNISRDEHRKYISLALELLNRIEGQAKVISRPWQSWIIINPSDSSEDAVYFHTPNPNKDNFPYDFSEIGWEIDIPSLLDGLITVEKHLVGEYVFDGMQYYWVQGR